MRYLPSFPFVGAGTKPLPPSADAVAPLKLPYVVFVSCVVIVPVVPSPLVNVMILPLTERLVIPLLKSPLI